MMEVITGGDFKRMVSGAYSEFLLEYEEINALSAAAGTHTLRTMGAEDRLGRQQKLERGGDE